jgi:hypothetical protein
VHHGGDPNLTQVADGVDLFRFGLGSGQSRQKQRGEDGADGDNDQKLN